MQPKKWLRWGRGKYARKEKPKPRLKREMPLLMPKTLCAPHPPIPEVKCSCKSQPSNRQKNLHEKNNSRCIEVMANFFFFLCCFDPPLPAGHTIMVALQPEPLSQDKEVTKVVQKGRIAWGAKIEVNAWERFSPGMLSHRLKGYWPANMLTTVTSTSPQRFNLRMRVQGCHGSGARKGETSTPKSDTTPKSDDAGKAPRT